jgi:hypothetical protein
MIRMSRPIEQAPREWLAKAQAETEEAIKAYKKARSAYARRKSPNKTLSFTFPYKVYGDDGLRDALNKVYGYKCAYCETPFGACQPVAVEHYRPKGEIVEGKVRTKPGYYWLAACWQNLLPSCTDCNSPRRHPTVGGKKVLRGKGNYFPLAPGCRRAKAPGQERREDPLLLNPEVDDPDVHLEFLTDREHAGVIRPKLIAGQPSRKGEESINVFALDRPGLIQGRAFFATRLLSHVHTTTYLLERCQESPGDVASRQEYEQNVKELREFLAPDQPYCAMSRQIVRAVLPGVNL